VRDRARGRHRQSYTEKRHTEIYTHTDIKRERTDAHSSRERYLKRQRDNNIGDRSTERETDRQRQT
jgi:hypothetical protein